MRERILASYYEWIKAFHIIAVISWMVGMLYLPRLFVYHAKVEIGSEQDKIFQIMERKLLRFIMNPAMIITIILGLALCGIYGWKNLSVWFHIKASSVLVLIIVHGFFAKWRKDFSLGKNIHSEKFFRYINELPTIAMIVAIIMVVVKPFD